MRFAASGLIAGGAHAREVALHVGHEDRHAGVGQALGHRLQGDRLAGARGAGDQAVAVGHLRQQGGVAVFGLGEIQGFGHGGKLRENDKILLRFYQC
jgi:hypothetical protein